MKNGVNVTRERRAPASSPGPAGRDSAWVDDHRRPASHLEELQDLVSRSPRTRAASDHVPVQRVKKYTLRAGEQPDVVWLLEGAETEADIHPQEGDPPATRWMRAGDLGKLEAIQRELARNQHRAFRMGGADDRSRHAFSNSIAKLYTTPSGRRLIHGLMQTEREIRILPGEERGSLTFTPGDESGQLRIPSGADDTARRYGEDHRQIAAPVFVSVGHELIHALRWATGQRAGITAQEEADTVGLSYPGGARLEIDRNRDVPTENLLRHEHGLPLRHYHQVQEEERIGELPPGFTLRMPGRRSVSERRK